MRFANFLRKFGDKKCDINFLVSEFHSIIAKYSMTLLERILHKLTFNVPFFFSSARMSIAISSAPLMLVSPAASSCST